MHVEYTKYDKFKMICKVKNKKRVQIYNIHILNAQNMQKQLKSYILKVVQLYTIHSENIYIQNSLKDNY